MQSVSLDIRFKDSGKVCLTVREAGVILTHQVHFGEKRKARKIVNLCV